MLNAANAIDATKSVLDFYEKNQNTYLEDLKTLTRIPSISFDGFPPEEVRRSAEAVRDLLKRCGLENVQLMEVPGTHPYVYGDWLHQPGSPTLLLYAHHDVQPPLREDLWNTPVFEPTEKNGRLYARGIADDKAGILIHVASIEAWLKVAKTLPINVKVIIEGEEEIGSVHLRQFLSQYKSQLQADCVILTDCTNYDTGIPSLTTTLRGLISVDVTVTALDHPLHSGMWGGPIPDPIQGLSKIIAALSGPDGKVAIPELWADVTAPTAEEIEDFRKLGMRDKLFRSQAGLADGVELFGHDDEILRKMWREPSIVVNSIQSGGKKIAGNVIMDSAWARIGLRLVPHMEHAKATKLFVEAIEKLCPWGLKIEVIPEQGANPWMTSPEHPVFSVAKKALSDGYEKEAVYIGCGGTIPFVESFTQALGNVPCLLVGVEDPYTNAHSENESLDLNDFHKAVRSQIHLFAQLAGRSELFR